MTRLLVVFVAIAAMSGVVACSSNPAALTADEWRWCQQHWRDGVYASKSNDRDSFWYFNHMGMPEDPDTIRVCRAAAKG